MLAGHVGAGLALSRLEPRLNVGALILAALLLDILLWVFVLLGLEQVVVPPDYAVHHQMAFVFPYSHGLVASLAWAGLAALLGCPWVAEARGRLAGVVAAAVLSHWLLDAAVHRPELPVLGSLSPHLGLGLWNMLPLALGLEIAIALGGLWLYLRHAGHPRRHRYGIASLTLVTAGFTVVGMSVAPPPPSGRYLAGSSLTCLAVIVGIALWMGRSRRTSPSSGEETRRVSHAT